MDLGLPHIRSITTGFFSRRFRRFGDSRCFVKATRLQTTGLEIAGKHERFAENI